MCLLALVPVFHIINVYISLALNVGLLTLYGMYNNDGINLYVLEIDRGL